MMHVLWFSSGGLPEDHCRMRGASGGMWAELRLSWLLLALLPTRMVAALATRAWLGQLPAMIAGCCGGRHAETSLKKSLLQMD